MAGTKKYKINGTAIICILARDVEKQLIKNIPKIDSLRDYFQNSWVVAVENDSTDRTKELLFNWQHSGEGIFIDSFVSNFNFAQKSEKGMLFSGASRSRIEKMAFIRNRYLNFIKNNNMHSDYIIVIDIDLYDFDEKKIASAIKNAPSNWSAIFANGRLYSTILKKIAFTKFYDTYACVPLNSKTVQLTYREQFLNRDLRMKKYTPCKSAFGGIGIYKYNSIINSEYKTINNERCSLQEVICEHILFNIAALNSGTNYICKDLKTYYQKVPVLAAVLPSKIFMRLLIWKHKIHKKMSPEIIALSGVRSQESGVNYVARVKFVKYQFAKTGEIRRCA